MKNISQIISRHLEIFNTDFSSSQTFAKLLIQVCLCEEIPTFHTIRRFYVSFKEIFNMILYSINVPIELKFATYYFKLMYKRKKLERMSVIKLDLQNYNLYFDVYCVFIIIFNKLAQKVKQKKLFSNLIQTFEDNKEVYPFQYNDISFNPNNFEEFQHEYNYLNQYC